MLSVAFEVLLNSIQGFSDFGLWSLKAEASYYLPDCWRDLTGFPPRWGRLQVRCSRQKRKVRQGIFRP